MQYDEILTTQKRQPEELTEQKIYLVRPLGARSHKFFVGCKASALRVPHKKGHCWFFRGALGGDSC